MSNLRTQLKNLVESYLAYRTQMKQIYHDAHTKGARPRWGNIKDELSKVDLWDEYKILSDKQTQLLESFGLERHWGNFGDDETTWTIKSIKTLLEQIQDD